MFPIDQLQGTYSWYKFTFVCMIILIPFVVLAASEGGRKVFVACLASCICVIAAPIVLLAEGWDQIYRRTPCGKKNRETPSKRNTEKDADTNSTILNSRKITSREASILIDPDGEAVPLWEKNWAETDAKISRMLMPIKHHRNCPEREKKRLSSAPNSNPFAAPHPGGVLSEDVGTAEEIDPRTCAQAVAKSSADNDTSLIHCLIKGGPNTDSGFESCPRESHVCMRHPYIKGSSYTQQCREKSLCDALGLQNSCGFALSIYEEVEKDNITEIYGLEVPYADTMTVCCCEDHCCNTAPRRGRGEYRYLLQHNVLPPRQTASVKTSMGFAIAIAFCFVHLV